MRRIPIGVKLTAMILPLVVFLVFIALRTVPQFKITTIKVVSGSGKERIPASLKEQLATYVGLSLFELNFNRLERELGSYPTIKSLELKRALPSSLEATVSLVESPALVQTTDGNRRWLPYWYLHLMHRCSEHMDLTAHFIRLWNWQIPLERKLP